MDRGERQPVVQRPVGRVHAALLERQEESARRLLDPEGSGSQAARADDTAEIGVEADHRIRHERRSAAGTVLELWRQPGVVEGTELERPERQGARTAAAQDAEEPEEEIEQGVMRFVVAQELTAELCRVARVREAPQIGPQREVWLHGGCAAQLQEISTPTLLQLDFEERERLQPPAESLHRLAGRPRERACLPEAAAEQVHDQVGVTVGGASEDDRLRGDRGGGQRRLPSRPDYWR